MTLLRTHASDELVLHRLYFALKPSEAAVAGIAAVRAQLGVAASHVADERLHVELFALDLPMTPPPGLIAEMGRVAARLGGAALRIEFGELAGDGAVTALLPGSPMPVLRAFQQRLALALAGAGIWPGRGFGFEPRLILAHGQQHSFRRAIRPVSWRANELVLVHSLTGLTEHVVLGRWGLAE